MNVTEPNHGLEDNTVGI